MQFTSVLDVAILTSELCSAVANAKEIGSKAD